MEVDTFCNELKEFLKHSGVSQNQLSKQSGVSQSQISDWSKGKLKRFGKNPRKVMLVIESYRKDNYNCVSEKVWRAVSDFCRGNHGRADALINILTILQTMELDGNNFKHR
ncbi:MULTISPECIES: helix-turn-helix domain-containing protein [unclassified Pseudoalteromonas]|uniref:helix-turn-helix domain-containing protein n=1 Tax=unclassified Pseudoalteromonas TaxID=194690 RepID=UPI001F350407|nr:MULTISPECIES: helix-turn-helix transcriptional regulator [unclassified Pseudoalteromonas]MCF2828780.1 helix-turn-helix transcriptional regulator [Pseudoalteromonas sp. OF5H-5]MCF2832282.1 helix-turn-helix transcriptional regulator [Pseudoalteromonas sp. DL2-H6]MCF2925048.1 helix-turn-helix transcriptional regulator [Pseudoalteromonas sp. DL2-H1]